MANRPINMTLNISIEPVSLADVPRLAKISSDAFILDRNTQVKRLGKNSYDLEAVTNEGMRRELSSPKFVVTKAVDKTTGEVVGFAAWGFREFEEQEIPRLADVIPFEEDPTQTGEKSEDPDEAGDPDDIIVRLVAMADADLDTWRKKLMPEGVKCMFVAGLNVTPEFQSRGVGKALLSWGTDVADRFGVHIWVPSSEHGWRAYASAGFEVVGSLDIDLDAWAPSPPPKEEGEGAIWGHYVFRYMKREPR